VTTLILYTTAACHLCEQAETLLQQAAQNHPLVITATEIGDNDQLVDRYGIYIPVIQKQTGEELFWPFNLTDLEKFIRKS